MVETDYTPVNIHEIPVNPVNSERFSRIKITIIVFQVLYIICSLILLSIGCINLIATNKPLLNETESSVTPATGVITFSKAPDLANRTCDSLRYGCCPHTETPASGPNFEGCSFANTTSGVTVKYGHKFERSPSDYPPQDTKISTHVCGLSKESGSCVYYTVKWYFDISYGGCNRFWYGGCDGNGNRFSSREQCDRACVAPSGVERCLLPKVSGPCNSSQIAWHYNSERSICERFIYSGCLGNTNRFEVKSKCEQSCAPQQQTVLDSCEQYPAVGPCRGTYRRWYYSRVDRQCKQFIYGGCKGNRNNFQTESDCRMACSSQTPQQICALPKSVGVCSGNFPLWYFDNYYGLCKEFIYTGCEGNRNRFMYKSSCEWLCNQTKIATITDKKNICELPKAEGPCTAAIIQWYFNAETSRCERFYFGGCGGNANRFEDSVDCEKACISRVSRINVCEMPYETGNCHDYREKWYYYSAEKRCRRFYYSGCGGNQNNFDTYQQCYQQCGRQIVSSTERSITEFKSVYCLKTYETGRCNRNEIRWFYDRKDGVCKQFRYGGCDGNENRFDTRSECVTKCWYSQDICQLAKVRGSCSRNYTQWYYDGNVGECQEFLFGGCDGNANRFNSKEICETRCKSAVVSGVSSTKSSVVSVSSPTNATYIDSCHQPYDTGSCGGQFPRWYYSVDENSCEQFTYGGCDGNSNRFEERSDCEITCVSNITKPTVVVTTIAGSTQTAAILSITISVVAILVTIYGIYGVFKDKLIVTIIYGSIIIFFAIASFWTDIYWYSGVCFVVGIAICFVMWFYFATRYRTKNETPRQ